MNIEREEIGDDAALRGMLRALGSVRLEGACARGTGVIRRSTLSSAAKVSQMQHRPSDLDQAASPIGVFPERLGER
ncbi:MAG: hypothetical protein ACKO3M_11280, partial [Rubrivivax sp.]